MSAGGDSGLEAQVGTRWSNTATNGSTGTAGNPITLTWGFVADGTTIVRAGDVNPAGNIPSEVTSGSNLQARLNAIYGSSATWLPLFQSVFNRWSALSGVSYVYTGLSDDGANVPLNNGVLGVRPDVRISGHAVDGGFNILAYNWFPQLGDMIIDTAELQTGGFMTNTSSTSLRLRNVVAHEHGHGLGFNHVDPINQTKLMEATASTAFDGPQFDDIYAAQLNYGDPFEKGGRNENFATASDLGTFGNLSNSAVSAWVSANNPTTPRSIANTGDFDYLKFTVTSSKNVSFTVSPFGPTYTQGPQGGATASFNASQVGRLSANLYSTNGTTVLSTSTAAALGNSVTVSANNLAAGTYYLRVGLASGSTQPFNVNATIADSVIVVPPAPSTPDLATASDSGSSNSDNVTNDNTPTFTGTAEVGSTVNLLFNGVSVGSVVATSGSYSITPTTRPDGVYSVTATATNSAGTGPASAALAVTIDTTAPLAPQNLRVFAADDSGLSNSDNITNDSTPRLTGDAEASSLVTIAGPGSFAGNFAGGSGFVASFGLVALPEGVSNVIATTTDLAGNSSTGIASLNVTVDTVAPAAPFANAIHTGDDSGVSALDGVTNVTTPRVVGTAENNALVEVLSGTTVLATATATGTYVSSALPPRPQGPQTYNVRATDLAGNVSTTNGLVTFLVDTTAPAVTGRAFVRSDRQALVVDFTEDVYATASLQFDNTTTSASFGTTQLVIDTDTREYRVPGNALTDGVYAASLATGTMTDLAGNALATSNPIASINYLRADFNNDGSVNFDDLLLLAATYNNFGNNTQGDANYDGTVNFDDLLILAGSYNTSLPGVGAVVAPPPASSGPAADDAENPPGLAADVL